ncbi:MAG: hypothetical protein J6K46_05130 [Sutterella sp.]|nr:hypothetical protein [Sutterella sp.]
MIDIYGIPTCGSVKKGIAWFREQNAETVFHNFRKEGLTAETLDSWLAKVPADVLLNRKGLLWRKVDEETRLRVKDNPQGMRDLMLDEPGLIKRPVIVFPDGAVTVGVNEALWAEHIR